MLKLKQFAQKHTALSVFATFYLLSGVIFGGYLIAHPELASIWKGEFTQEGWRNYPWLRFKIVDDMETKIDIWNLSKEEVRNILGPPHEENDDLLDDGGSYYNYIIRVRADNPMFGYRYEYRYNRLYGISFSMDGSVTGTSILYPS